MVLLGIEMIFVSILINLSKKSDDDSMPSFGLGNKFRYNSMVRKLCIACYYGQSKVSISVYLAIKRELCSSQYLIVFLKWGHIRDMYVVSISRRILFFLKTSFIDYIVSYLVSLFRLTARKLTSKFGAFL